MPLERYSPFLLPSSTNKSANPAGTKRTAAGTGGDFKRPKARSSSFAWKRRDALYAVFLPRRTPRALKCCATRVPATAEELAKLKGKAKP
jgi:hypothetical protein